MEKTKQPWPTKAAMEQIYEMKLWGTGADHSCFFSGLGSHQKKFVSPYIDVVSGFLKAFKKPLVICDLGCGDFNIGKQLVSYSKYYYGIDIVTKLITHNRSTFKYSNLEFRCLDIATDDLPEANCVILRQVLQHLSNTEIQQIVKKLYKYKYVILTEHVPNYGFVPNIDIISGQGIRLKKQSGVNLLEAPFNLKVISKKELLFVMMNTNKEVVITTLYRHYPKICVSKKLRVKLFIV